MSIGIKCDLCGIPIGATETCSVFRMWNGVRCVEIEDSGLRSLPFDEDFYVCDECFARAYDLLMKLRLKVVER